MKKLILVLLNKNFDFIVKDWADKIFQSVGDKLTISQIVTYVKRTLNIIIEIIELTDYSKADQYLLDTHNLFSDAKLNLLQISDIFRQGRFAILHCIERDETEEYDSIIILGFIDEIIEQIYARYGMIHQAAQMKELVLDRDRLANKLEMNQQYLKNILHSSDSAIMIIDKNEKFIAWNQGAEKIFGYTEKEVLGKPSSLLLPNDETYIEELNFLKNEVQKHGYLTIKETERKAKDGRQILVQLTVSKLPGGNNSYVGRLVVIEDITQVKILQRQIDQSEKLAVIGQLAAGIAHEIGNPLASISSLVQILQRKNTDDFYRGQLVTIKENIDRITKIVRELVDFSRPPSDVETYLQITEIIKTALGIVKYDKRVKKVEFKTNLNGNLPKIKIVPDQLLQVLVNTLINSLDAIEGNGIITVNSRYDNDNIYVEITDDGCGIEKDNIDKIFDPFFTTKEVGKGTGLGLSVSYGIVKKFNGDIIVDSKLNEYSRFTIKLPIIRE